MYVSQETLNQPGGRRLGSSSLGEVRSVALLPDFPEVRITAARLDIREFGPGDAGLVREVLRGGEWLPLSTALVETTEHPADVDWWLADAVHEPRRERTGLNLMMLARNVGQVAGWIYLTDVDRYARCAEIGYGVRPRARGQGFATEALAALSRWALTTGGLQRVWLNVNTDNLASLRVAQKAGFAREGTLRRASMEADGLHDVAVLALLDDEI
jgi:RimJ/RimL family protein N-acetyltransferase